MLSSFFFVFLILLFKCYHGAKHSPLLSALWLTFGWNFSLQRKTGKLTFIFPILTRTLQANEWISNYPLNENSSNVWRMFCCNQIGDWRSGKDETETWKWKNWAENSKFSWFCNFSQIHQGSIEDDLSMSEQCFEMCSDWIWLPEIF